MPDQIPLFRCRLSRMQSIGPAALRKLWSNACGSDNVKVNRVMLEAASDERECIYSFSGPPHMANLPQIEVRLRRLLAELSPTATIKLTSLG